MRLDYQILVKSRPPPPHLTGWIAPVLKEIKYFHWIFPKYVLSKLDENVKEYDNIFEHISAPETWCRFSV